MEALRTDFLSKNYDGVKAVQNVSLSVATGERRAIIGPNGSGKSTLLNLIAGELIPSAGRIHIFGQDVTSLPSYKRFRLGLGHTFQITNVFSNLTVLNNAILAIQAMKSFRFNMFVPISAYGTLIDEARTLLEQWDLWEKRHLISRELPYGEQRRMELALSLGSRPKIVLMDEPTAGLSPAEVASFSSIVRKLLQDVTLILVAHDMDVVFDIADTITVLHYGEVIISAGTRDEIKADPRVREVYLGSEQEPNDIGTG